MAKGGKKIGKSTGPHKGALGHEGGNSLGGMKRGKAPKPKNKK